MTSPYAALGQLRACLAGAPPPGCDWIAVVRLANGALLTPQLAAALQDAAGLPEDLRAFLADVRGRNGARNRRLFDQLTETVGALNRAGIEPTLLKGAALWATRGPDEPFDRLLTDLDLLVRPEEVERARTALALQGYRAMAERTGAAVHAVAELARPDDVGSIDLHQRAPGPPGLAEAAGSDLRPIAWGGVAAKVPTPAAAIALAVLHDQFHDGDYWRGGFDLRRLHDIAAITARPEGVDWTRVFALCGTRLARRAAAVQLLAARRLAGAAVPQALVERPLVRLQHARRLAQFRWPGLKLPLAAIAVLAEAPSLVPHALENRRSRARLLGPAASESSPDRRVDRLRDILTGPEAGKI